MGIISFFKEAGEKLFGSKDTEAAAAQAAKAPDQAELQARAAQANETAARAIEKYIATQNLSADGLRVEFDGATSAVTVSGVAPDQPTREKILLCCGNVNGVAQVSDMMTVAQPAASLYPKIFDANKPMLTHPDKIYPGQLLRIPPA